MSQNVPVPSSASEVLLQRWQDVVDMIRQNGGSSNIDWKGEMGGRYTCPGKWVDGLYAVCHNGKEVRASNLPHIFVEQVSLPAQGGQWEILAKQDAVQEAAAFNAAADRLQLEANGVKDDLDRKKILLGRVALLRSAAERCSSHSA